MVSISYLKEKGIYIVSKARSTENHVKHIVHHFVYGNTEIKLLAFDSNTEAMVTLVAYLATCGFSKVKHQNLQKVSSKSKPLDGKGTVKFDVKIQATEQFSEEFLSEDSFKKVKESLLLEEPNNLQQLDQMVQELVQEDNSPSDKFLSIKDPQEDNDYGFEEYHIIKIN